MPSVHTPPRIQLSMIRTAATHALSYAFIGVFFIWLWYPLFQGLFLAIGVQSPIAGFMTILTFAGTCTWLGYQKAKKEHQPSPRPGVTGAASSSNPPVPMGHPWSSPRPSVPSIAVPPVIPSTPNPSLTVTSTASPPVIPPTASPAPTTTRTAAPPVVRSPSQWASSRDYVEAIQNPQICFLDPDLKAMSPALDRLGMPLVTSGQFAYVFKLNSNTGGRAQAVRCFRGFLGDREQRYQWISEHLDKVATPYFAEFEYDPQGILVLGKHFPILTMEWVDGFPLDVYIPNVLSRPDVLSFLANLWLKVLQTIRDGGMAHGDLQHGNIIVDSSNTLRLVDLDGMFVPAMAGWKAAELGHQHYQHPRRRDNHFDARLDNFPGLVIYLSLIALAQRPALWDEFHDENLIFRKRDFDHPRNSPLFVKVKDIGGEAQLLAQALERACTEDPSLCPSVLDMIGSATSRLPIWMLSAPSVTIQQTTREVKSGTGHQPSPPLSVPSGTTTPTSPGSRQRSPWWQGAKTSGPSQPISRSVSPSPSVTSKSSPPVIQPAPNPSQRVVPPAARTQGKVVGSRIRMIYHRPSCHWAMKISYRNRAEFYGVADAQTAGYRPCSVCSP